MIAPRSYRPVLVVGTAVIIYVLAVLQRLSPPVIALEIMGDLGLTLDDMSLMFAMTIIAYAVMQPISGFCADRFGPRRCLLTAALLLGVSSIVFSQSQGLVTGLGSRTIVGLAAGITIMACMKLAIHWFSPERFGLINSFIIASAALANFAVGRPLAVSVEILGWRSTFFWLGIIGLALALAVYFLIYDHPQREKFKDQSPGASQPGEEISFAQGLALIIRNPRFWLLGFLYGLTDMPYAVLTGLWIGPYLMEVHGQSEAAVGNMLSISAFGFLIGPPLWMLLADYWRSLSKVVFLAIAANFLLGIFLVIGPGGVSTPLLYFLVVVTPVGGQIAGIMLILAKDLAPAKLSASAMGLMNTFPFIFGAAMQKVVGDILTRTELVRPALSAGERYSQAFQPYLALMALGLFLALWQVRLERKGRAAAAGVCA